MQLDDHKLGAFDSFDQMKGWAEEGGGSRLALSESRQVCEDLSDPLDFEEKDIDLRNKKNKPDVDVALVRDHLELKLLKQMTDAGIPEPVREHRFHATRKWRFDFAWPELKIAAEVEGGTWSKGKSRHTTGAGFQADLEKYNAARMDGWMVYQFDSKHIETGFAAEFLVSTVFKDML